MLLRNAGIIAAAGATSSSLLQTGLIAEHRFDNGTGQLISDYSGNGHNAQLGSTSGVETTDPTWNAGGWTTGDGVDDFALVDPGTAIRTGSFSVLVRPEFTIDGSSVRRCLSFGSGQMQLSLDHPNPQFAQSVEIRRASDNAFLSARFGTIAQNTWVVIHGVFDGTNLKAYRNGLLQNTTPVNGNTTGTYQRIAYHCGLTADVLPVPANNAACSIAYGIVRTHPMTDQQIADEYQYIRTQVSSRGIALPAQGEQPPPVLFTRQITAASDDAEENVSTGAVKLDSTDLDFLFDDFDAASQIVGVRFPTVMIPQGAQIVSAYIQFSAENPSESAGSPTFTIQGHLSVDAPTFGTATNSISGRTRTSASVSWSPPAWTVADQRETAQRTADLSPIVQQLVNQAGWQPGGAMGFIVTGTQSVSARRTAHSSESLAHAPALVIEYIGEALGPGWAGVAVDDSFSVVAGSGVTALNVQANDTGLDGSETTQLLSGAATVNADGKRLNYTAPASAGSENLTYRLSHAASGQTSNTATVAVTTTSSGGGGGGDFPANHNMGTIVSWAGISLMPGSTLPPNRTWPTTFRTPEQHGAVGNGTTNDEPAINACLAFAKSNGMGVRFGAGKIYRMNDKFSTSVLNGWNSILWEGNGATIRIGPGVTAESGPGTCQFMNCRGIRIYDLTLDGRRATRHAVTNDYFGGHNFSMLSCHDVAFIRCNSHRAMTDGWRLAATQSLSITVANIPTWNVLIDCEGFDNVRLGIGIIHGQDIYIKRGRYNDHKVRAPTAGIDIEPTHHFDATGISVRRCQIDGVEFSDNYKFGFVLVNLGETTIRDVWVQNCLLQRNGGRNPLHGAQGSHAPFYINKSLDNVNYLNNTVRDHTQWDSFTRASGFYIAIGASGNVRISGNKFSGNSAKTVNSQGATVPATTIFAHGNHGMSSITLTNNLIDIRNTGNPGVNVVRSSPTGNTVWRKASDGLGFAQNAGANTTNTVTHDNPVF